MNSHSDRILRNLMAAAMIAVLFFGLSGMQRVQAAGPWYVSNSGNDANDCLSDSTACQTITGAIAKASAGDTINVLAGTYIENVNVNKAITLVGAGAETTSIVGTTGNATPLTFGTSSAVVSGFTITHNYTQAELDAWNFNNNGVTFNQSTSGNRLENCVVSLNRNGVYLNNTQSNIITGNTITNNRTGINFTNTINGTQITNNTISDNWTLGLVYYSQGLAADFSTVTVTGNTFSNNWYTEILIKDAGSSTGSLNVANNTFTDNPITYSTSSDSSLNEPSFATQKPVALGGTATKPAQDLPTFRIYNSPSASYVTGPKTLQVGAAPLFTTIQAAIDAASAGDTITVLPGTYVLTDTLRVDKDVTLVGVENPLIQVSGTGYKISMTAAGATLQGFWIESTDKADQQAIIYVAASNLTIQGNKIWGTYVFGESQVSRAMVFTGGLSGLTIADNEIYDLRQPGYISGVTTGTISNNYVYRTRGWVIEQGNMTFTDNTWGTGTDANVYDIAILSTVDPTYYTDVPALSEANHNASIEDQRTTPATLSIVYVDGSVASSGTGSQASPKKTITEGITRVVAGGTVYVAPGTYVEDLAIDKALTLLGPNAEINPNTGVRGDEAILLPATSNPDPNVCSVMAYISVSDVTIKGFTFNGDNPDLTSGVIINGADVDACEHIASYEGVGNIVIEDNILKYSTYTGMDFYNYTNDAATTGNYIRYNQIEDIGETTYNWGIGVLVYNNFYADVTDNVFNRVRTGVQTGNYYRANPGTTGSISHNTINAWRGGIFHNLWYSNASPITVADNTITAVSNPGATKWNGILVSSFQSPASTIIRDNTITIPDTVTYPAPGYAAGYNIWNVSANSAITIQGGTVDGGDYGVFVNNFEGYASNASNTSVAIRGVTSRSAKVAGIYVKDSSDNTNGATVHADILSNQIEGAATGILVEGSDATAIVHWNRIADVTTAGLTNTSGTLVDATNNWWGCNEGPTDASCASVSDLVDADPWLVLTLTADQTQLTAGGTINLVASLKNNSDGIDTSASGLVMDGIQVEFATTYGALNPVSAGLLDGSAAFTLTVPDPLRASSATVTATLDDGIATVAFEGEDFLIFLPFVNR